MSENHQIIKVEFNRFKAFERFILELRHFNILVGPNNAGKSTILVAFRVLAAALRKAWSRSPERIRGPHGDTFGYVIDLKGISVAEENIFYNYNDDEPSTVVFQLSNGNELQLYFPEVGACYLIASSGGPTAKTPSTFRKNFNCSIGFVPILGPVDQVEALYQEETARLSLFNYTAARNFRNIWYHYPEKFEEFRRVLKETWPGMDIEAPQVTNSNGKARLHMFCPEERIPREIFWAGFGFQVWCQMLTHLVQSSEKSIFLIDEPDIYLHADLQRQLLGILRNLGPDILIATHSTEIISEAEPDDIVIINKKRKRGRRIKHPSDLAEVFTILGSNLNPILTQLAKTRRVVFVEGKDFQIIGKFARKLKSHSVGNRTEFAVIPVEGFNPERMRNLKKGMETTLGGKIAAAAILDRDFRSDKECDFITQGCRDFCDMIHIHKCKEIENFLLSPGAIDRAAANRVQDRSKRTRKSMTFEACAKSILDNFVTETETFVTSRFLAARAKFDKSSSPGTDQATTNESALLEFNSRWKSGVAQLQMVAGKEAFSRVNQNLDNRYGVTITSTAVIDAMKFEEIPVEMKRLIADLAEFASIRPGLSNLK